jgi:hypothetical protein
MQKAEMLADRIITQRLLVVNMIFGATSIGLADTFLDLHRTRAAHD